jgi:hypothetical protein
MDVDTNRVYYEDGRLYVISYRIRPQCSVQGGG